MDGDNGMTVDYVTDQTKLIADEGKIISDKNGVLGAVIWIGSDRTIDEFFEVDFVNEDEQMHDLKNI